MTKMYMNHSTLDAKTDLLKRLPNYLHPEKIKNTKEIDIKKELLSMDQDNWQAVRDRILKVIRWGVENNIRIFFQVTYYF